MIWTFYRHFLPLSSGGHILLTTRARDMQRLAQRIEVETLSDDQGTLFLLRRAGLLALDASLEQANSNERMQARNLVQEMGGLPLALDQAGAYLDATGMSLEEYQRIYKQHRRMLLQERRSRVSDHPLPVATTWSLSFQKMEEKNAAAADLLRLCAYLAADAIPEAIITKGAPHFDSPLKSVAADLFLFAQAIEALRTYSLLDRDPQTQTLSVHRLVQAVLRDSLGSEEAKAWKRRVVLAVNEACPDVTDVKQWDACERWLPHAEVCATWIEQEQMTLFEAARLLNQAGYYLDDRARYNDAESLYVRALAIKEQHLGPQHPSTATSLNNLAGLYRRQGKYGDAEPLYVRALAIDEKALGAMHPDVAIDLNNLALLYGNQGKYGDAEPLYVRALAIHEQHLGPQHPNTATSLTIWQNCIGVRASMAMRNRCMCERWPSMKSTWDLCIPILQLASTIWQNCIGVRASMAKPNPCWCERWPSMSSTWDHSIPLPQAASTIWLFCMTIRASMWKPNPCWCERWPLMRRH